MSAKLIKKVTDELKQKRSNTSYDNVISKEHLQGKHWNGNGVNDINSTHHYDEMSSSSSSPSLPFKGFSTPIHSMFRNDENINNNNNNNKGGTGKSINHLIQNNSTTNNNNNNNRIDCCSIACCGILQADRNEYLLRNGIYEPPSFFKRLFVHILIPFGLFVGAGMSAVMIEKNVILSELLVWSLSTYFVGWIILGCCKGRAKRVRARKATLWKVQSLHRQRHLQQQSLKNPHAKTDEESTMIWNQWKAIGVYENQDVDDIQSNYDISCASYTIGCYAENALPLNETITSGEAHRDNFCSRIWECLIMFVFCGRWTGHVLQCFGCCAIAQEAREIERILPISVQRFDYITMEPYVHYVNKLRVLRIVKSSSFMDHVDALSRLSTRFYKLIVFLFVSSLVTGTLGTILHSTIFTAGNTFILLGNFGQAFFLLYVIYWRKHSNDISLDAVIKYFACGFFLCTFLALLFEFVIQMTLKGLIAIFLNDDLVTEPTIQMNPITLGLLGVLHGPQSVLMTFYNVDFIRNHLILVIVYMVVSTYLIAALVEELCKYFCYRMVDHPDFLTEQELIEATATPSPPIKRQHKPHSQNMNRENDSTTSSYDDSEYDEEENNEQTNETYKQMEDSNKDGDSDKGKNSSMMILPGDHKDAMSKGSGITIAMCSVAIGFACCENLIYIYIYTEPFVRSQLMVLLLRSIFPIHPICAAIQSIYVCQSTLERDSNNIGRRIELRNIIFPSVLFHGSFDFCILLFVLIGLVSETYIDTMWISLSSCFVIMCIGYLFYYRESQKQNNRLIHHEQTTL